MATATEERSTEAATARPAVFHLRPYSMHFPSRIIDATLPRSSPAEVTSRLNARIRRILGDNAVDKKAPVGDEQSHVAWVSGVAGGRLNPRRIAWPQRGQRGPAGNPQPQGSRGAPNFSRGFAPQPRCMAENGFWRSHETLWLCRHENEVPLILPHDRAVVTNTSSKRKDGFS
jgi:hypothetical protein